MNMGGQLLQEIKNVFIPIRDFIKNDIIDKITQFFKVDLVSGIQGAYLTILFAAKGIGNNIINGIEDFDEQVEALTQLQKNLEADAFDAVQFEPAQSSVTRGSQTEKLARRELGLTGIKGGREEVSRVAKAGLGDDLAEKRGLSLQGARNKGKHTP